MLAGKIILVTGASRGIGAAIADTLGQAGARVIGTATQASGAEAITARFSAKGITGEGIALDVSNSTMIETVFDTITARVGAPVVLVNNAGIARDQLLLRMKASDWDDVLATNLSAVFHLSKLCIRGMMKARWGRIISIGSVVGTMGQAGQANYAAAKAGLEGFSKSLAQEVASRGITVNMVSPGFIATEMTGALPADRQAAILAQIPVGVMGTPEDIAQAVLFLATDAARYITGVTLHVNGGMHM